MYACVYSIYTYILCVYKEHIYFIYIYINFSPFLVQNLLLFSMSSDFLFDIIDYKCYAIECLPSVVSLQRVLKFVLAQD